ncbi:MAG: hypothetical protein ACPH5V_10665, partial [Alcanivorax sp.]
MPSDALISALRDAHKAHLTQRLQAPEHWQGLMAQAGDLLTDIPLGNLVDQDSLVQVVDQWLQEALSARGLQAHSRGKQKRILPCRRYRACCHRDPFMLTLVARA